MNYFQARRAHTKQLKIKRKPSERYKKLVWLCKTCQQFEKVGKACAGCGKLQCNEVRDKAT